MDLETALRNARDFIAMSDNSTGCCMCGDYVDGHTIGSGHSPVDEGDYHAAMILKEIDEALNDTPPNN